MIKDVKTEAKIQLFFAECQTLLLDAIMTKQLSSFFELVVKKIKSEVGANEAECAVYLHEFNAFHALSQTSKNQFELHAENSDSLKFKTNSTVSKLISEGLIAPSNPTHKPSEKYVYRLRIANDAGALIGELVLFVPPEVRLDNRQLKLIASVEPILAKAFHAYEQANIVDSKIQTLERDNEKFRAFIKVMPDLALIISKEGVYEDVYGSPNNLLYISATALVHKNVRDVFPPDAAQRIMNVISRALQTNSIQEYEYPLEEENRIAIFEARVTPVKYHPGENEIPSHVLWMARDVTDEKKNQDRITELAYFDHLTNLPNRRMFNERLELAVKTKKASHEFGAILFLDLDNFKRVNDSLGHLAGDELLTKVAKRLKKSLRKTDVLARIGGDEFVILVENVGHTIEQSQSEVAVVAKKVQAAFFDKFIIGDFSLKISSSIGICFIDDHSDAQSIMKFADTAMYSAKRKGGDLFSFYDAENQTLLERQLTFESEIVSAIENNQFCAFFQAQVDADGKLCGAEALIRWNHPERGLVPPNEFISVAEQFGLIQKLQDIVLEDMCKLINLLEKKQALTEGFRLSINISHSQFRSLNFEQMLCDILKKHKVSASKIILEITESMLALDIEQTINQMSAIARLGFKFSIDDFGTGYSSLSNLHLYPVEELKIDKSFIDRITDEGGLSIVETIISLAKNLNMNIVAEGVENQEQIALLKARDLNVMQGYYFSKPLPMEDYIEWHCAHTK
ncbi:putative bifunctional diguanylate cyclase/phosphodiesterase [Brumicola blandensis]|uniref:EAL domain-containing protein n=1 Tax=Brumicola blandensis TaxID=3075611 RepID=A0AAW8QYL1_9ALTE|nr:EAL domain-containing protein [Alteromonas sp. W409]MDT0582176.1 EAL domain-containing protein [Alteromonas sp. W409]